MPKIEGEQKGQRKERLLTLISKYASGFTEAEIADEMGMAQKRRSVNNYLRELEREGWIYKEENSILWFPLRPQKLRLGSFKVSPEEAMTLYIAVRLLAKQQDKRNEVASTALVKLAQLLSEGAMVGPEIEQAARELSSQQEHSAYEMVFRRIMQSLIYRKKVEISYKPLNGQPFTTVFAPYLIEPSAIGFTTYVIGHSSRPNDIRCYKFERIQSIQFTQENFVIPSDFPGLDILRNSWLIISGEQLVRVALRFSPRVKERVLETRWHPSQAYEPDKEKPGYLRWWVDVADTTDMLPWIRSWGADCELLEPISLRQKMIGEVKLMAQAYNWQVSTQTSNRNSSTLDDFFGD